MLKSKINKLLGDSFKKILLSKQILTTDEYSHAFYSQVGEDSVLSHIFEKKRNGFFVDVGAYHPKCYSNTYLLYKKGWRGINLDAMPGSMEIFNKIRPEDINLEIPIGQKEERLTYYIYEDKAYNGFFKTKPTNIKSKLKKTKKIITLPLSEVLKKHIPKGTKIDLLTIDVEGMDYEVLLSNDWNKFKPTVVIVEEKSFSVESKSKSKIYEFLKSKNYTLYSFVPPSLIFIKKN